ncbi:MAG: hypothetical protein A3G33_03415 [Omnitrophica bacterium RIFCSPLOWO2_12_FULL_44_17]|uniref:Type IV pilus modification protein PilV n=1 Tax=Candidatus Danuiimicrobium aquiferis TaxID=1801832 RepID=A0A1G1KTX7_9BACT|nr:MAG: hypothetical protein A3B72_06960 [Omnitrophica bacterium RIFCSPHIGHO2_02_FULL_45_28]OGW96366.1 MAG: hypothetical protein A3G33_03415 [Omnitrophica bacterium RIFCSPLOWO2_12_FULL_44_17]OGX04825.1 MAG: hypothetical protein A3J12_07715 [Omnitrophica bacterium RIFCSPLOWO2_02_FULL_44_11]
MVKTGQWFSEKQRYIKNVGGMKSGFSLVEVIISMMVIAIVALGAFAAMNYSKKSSKDAEEKMIAVSIVERKLNEFRTLNVLDLNVYNDFQNTVTLDTNTINGDISSFLNNGLIQDRIVQPNPPNDPAYKEVTVQVTWLDRLNFSHEVTMTVTLLAA